jgi:hypothetical protein
MSIAIVRLRLILPLATIAVIVLASPAVFA